MTSTCRHCGSALEVSFCNLGTSPFANSLIEPHRSGAAEKHYPLELGRAAAFASIGPEGERLVVVAEVVSESPGLTSSGGYCSGYLY
jgi:hypothetical protein